MPDRWYKNGLSFECAGCGDCCRGTPGYVWVTLEEAERIARHLAMPLGEFETTCLRHVMGRMSLLEKPNGDCIFWERDAGCRVYDLRPLQCRTFPFWKQNIKNPSAWDRLASGCPGIGRGRLYCEKEIADLAARTW